MSKSLKSVKAVIFDMQETLYTNSRLYPDTEQFLKNLMEKGIALAVLSNAPKTVVENILAEFKLTKFFDSIICAPDYDTTKPDPMLIGITLAVLGDAVGKKIGKNQILFIGDRPSKDIRCAKQGGIKAVRVLRGLYTTEIPEDKYETADFEVKDFKEVQKLLA
ncbi:MAG: HAD family hydrolase [Candidatus Aenigmarchaeota archaeon]|nr:HAD family hydrolase [Candidatus Aenigmarchaeota archaeon]